MAIEPGAMTVVLIVAVGVLSWLSVGAIRRYALARGVLDKPSERSSHAVPTPRGGGAGLIGAAIVGYLMAAPEVGMSWRVLLGLVAVLPTAIAGWLDDHRGLPVLPRFAAHIASGLLLLPMAIDPALPAPMAMLMSIGWVIVTVSAINVVNFMDGIDGLIGLQALMFAVHLVLLDEFGAPGSTLGIALASASASFLLWNWKPARIFLGDVGSGALAVLGLFGGILVWRGGGWSFLAVFLPLFPIFLDASVAIVRRASKGESLTVAHRTHLYQRLANEGRWGHARVSLLYGAAAFVGTIAASPGSLRWPIAAIGVYVGSVAVLGWWLDRTVQSRVEP